jgi:hypothetical protein
MVASVLQRLKLLKEWGAYFPFEFIIACGLSTFGIQNSSYNIKNGNQNNTWVETGYLGSVHLLANVCGFCSGCFLLAKKGLSQVGSQKFPADVIGRDNLQSRVLQSSAFGFLKRLPKSVPSVYVLDCLLFWSGLEIGLLGF